jgi:hypothetical protein
LVGHHQPILFVTHATKRAQISMRRATLLSNSGTTFISHFKDVLRQQPRVEQNGEEEEVI